MPAPPQRPLTAADHLDDVAAHIEGIAAQLGRDADTVLANAEVYHGRIDLPRVAQDYRERAIVLGEIAAWVRNRARLVRMHDEAQTVRTHAPRRPWWRPAWLRWPW